MWCLLPVTCPVYITDVVSTSCYLFLEGELGQLVHGGRGECLLCGHPHATQDDDDEGEDEEHAARHPDEDVGVVVLRALLQVWSRTHTAEASLSSALTRVTVHTVYTAG